MACVRLLGSHTYEVLAEAIERIHVDFKIENKVTMTTTDNARNFAKAFVQFGSECDLLPPDNTKNKVSDATVTDLSPQDTEENLKSDDEENDSDEQIQVEFVEVAGLPPEDDEAQRAALPSHMRCGAHTWNLVAAKDSAKALQSAEFKTAYRGAMGKAQALWNRQNQSTVTADALYSELNRRLVVPNDTRWNSQFDALVCLTSILEEKRDNLRRVMVHHGLPTFNQKDIEFMKEYVKVMQPVATVLDKIQSDENGYLGWLLPLCATTVIRLQKVKTTGLKYCDALVDALINGARSRFDPMLDNDECLLAAGFHPR